MTKKELSQYYWIKREIEADEKRLRNLRESIQSPKAMRLTAMPTANGAHDSIGDAVAEMTDIEAIIAAKQIQCIHVRQRIERFICSVQDSMVRQVLMYRCIDGMTWKEVAAAMGHRMSEENARQIFHRALKTQTEEVKKDS